MNSENISQLIERLAPQLNAATFVEPRYKRYGVIFFQNGKRLFFKNKQVNINISSTVSVIRNKFETSCFLSHFGYRVPVGKTVSKHNYDIKHNRGLNDGLLFIKEIGFPVILKPNDKSQGILVCKVTNEKEYYKTAKKILKKKEDILLIEKFYENYSDYRIVVLGNSVISAYQRIPLTVVGNGYSTILELLKKKRKELEKNGRTAKEKNINNFSLKLY
jgi:D-alanine-D-alanine ligase-like ATP-grasp enzyme